MDKIIDPRDKKCPICGTKYKVLKRGEGDFDDITYEIVCPKCRRSSGEWDTLDEAIEDFYIDHETGKYLNNIF